MLSDCINFVLTRAQNSVFIYFKSKLSPFDITPAQYAILKCLWDNGDQSPTQISQCLHLDASTITGILTRLENKDMIQRINSKTDRRAVIVRIKEAGLALREPIELAIDEANQEMLSALSVEELNHFRQYIDRITETAENTAVDQEMN